MARRSSQQPATAYDYRRAITLVQLLEINATLFQLKLVARSWGVATFNRDSRDELLQRMAEHALRKAKESERE